MSKIYGKSKKKSIIHVIDLYITNFLESCAEFPIFITKKKFTQLLKFFSIYFSFCILIQYKHIKMHGNVLYHGQKILWKSWNSRNSWNLWNSENSIYATWCEAFSETLHFTARNLRLQSKNRVSRETGGLGGVLWLHSMNKFSFHMKLLLLISATFIQTIN